MVPLPRPRRGYGWLTTWLEPVPDAPVVEPPHGVRKRRVVADLERLRLPRVRRVAVQDVAHAQRQREALDCRPGGIEIPNAVSADGAHFIRVGVVPDEELVQRELQGALLVREGGVVLPSRKSTRRAAADHGR